MMETPKLPSMWIPKVSQPKQRSCHTGLLPKEQWSCYMVWFALTTMLPSCVGCWDSKFQQFFKLEELLRKVPVLNLAAKWLNYGRTWFADCWNRWTGLETSFQLVWCVGCGPKLRTRKLSKFIKLRCKIQAFSSGWFSFFKSSFSETFPPV